MSFLLPTTINLTWKLFGVISGFAITAAGIVASATWVYRMDYLDALKTEIASRKEASEWKVPETIKKLKLVSEKLDRQLTSLEETETLKTKNQNLERDNSNLKSSLAKAGEERTKLDDQISRLNRQLKLFSLPTKEFTLKKGESLDLIKNETILGVQYVYETSVSITINNVQESARVGFRQKIKSLNKMCIFTLTKIAQPESTFTLTCDDLPLGSDT